MSVIRLFVSSIVGASVAVLFLYTPYEYQFIPKILLAPFMVLIMAKFDGIKSYLVNLLVFCLMTFSLGGMVFGFSFLFNIDISTYASLGLTCLSLIILILVVKCIVNTRSNITKKVEVIELNINSISIKAKALYDSGNSLTDDYSGLPVVIISRELENKLNKLNEQDSLAIEGYISVKTINGESNMPLIRLDSVIVDKKSFLAYGVLSKGDFQGCELILQNTMF